MPILNRIRDLGRALSAHLGRQSEPGDALDAAHHPEHYGATDDIEMVHFLRDGDFTPDSYRSKLQTSLGAHAQSLVHQMGLGHRQHRTSHEEIHADTDSQGIQNAGIFAHLLMQYARPHKDHHKHHRLPSNVSTISETEPLPSTATASTSTPHKPKKDKWYDDGRKGKKKDTKQDATAIIAALLTRQRFLLRLCRAFMKYGAPTHRLEEYLSTTASVLGVNAQFLYLPGSMILSFDDPVTRTTEVQVVREGQGLELGRLADTHDVYKNVVHGVWGVERATDELDALMKRNKRYHPWWMLVLMSGIASVAVGPWAFDARPIDLPIIFVLGCLLGLMQNVLAPASPVYSNVFEVTAAVLMSFLARGFGSIKSDAGGHVFCFSALTQSSIALILPGYSVLCSSLELQSHQIVAGSVRLVFTIIYSLFLGYGVTVGITVYGLLDDNATRESSCPSASLLIYGNTYIQHFVFVPIYCALAALLSQAKLRQLPVMSFLGVSGYVANYWSTRYLDSRIGNTIGAFTIGLLANLYSRLWHGHAAASIVPGMWTLVSSGLATSGSIMSGLAYSEAVREGTVSTENAVSQASLQRSLSGLGYTMVQTALSITAGLFLAALAVYPYGKQRTGLFNL